MWTLRKRRKKSKNPLQMALECTLERGSSVLYGEFIFSVDGCGKPAPKRHRDLASLVFLGLPRAAILRGGAGDLPPS